jgi:hypothetical protein
MTKSNKTKWGVIGVKWRRVPCTYKPERAAPTPSWPTPTPPIPQQGMRAQRWGGGGCLDTFFFACALSFAPPKHPLHHQTNTPIPKGSRPTRDWPEYAGERDAAPVFDDGVAPYWWVEQWNSWVQPQSDAAQSGLRKGQGFCAKISQQVCGAVVVAGLCLWGLCAMCGWGLFVRATTTKSIAPTITTLASTTKKTQNKGRRALQDAAGRVQRQVQA